MYYKYIGQEWISKDIKADINPTPTPEKSSNESQLRNNIYDAKLTK